MSDLRTISPDELPEIAEIPEDLRAVVFSPGGPFQAVPHERLLAKLIATDLCKDTKEALDADLAHPADSVALVFGDPTADLNGWYRKLGAGGAGSWEQFEELARNARLAAEAAAAAAIAAAAEVSSGTSESIEEAAAAAVQQAVGYTGRSARFPYRNRDNGANSPFACLAQGVSNMGTWFGADGAMVMTLTIPRERLRASMTGQSNVSRYPIGNAVAAGGNLFFLNFGGAAGVFQTRLNVYFRSGVAIYQPSVLLPESHGSRVLIALRRSSNQWLLDCWDCETGTKYSLNTADASTFPAFNPATAGSFFQVGAAGLTDTAPAVAPFGDPSLHRGWEGDIGLVGYHVGALTDAQIEQIALGAPVETATTAANWRWVRELDGSAGSLAKPAWATGDTTPAATAISAGNLQIERGSSITAKGTHFTLGRRVAGDAHVDAVNPGQAVKSVAVGGRVRASLPAADVIEVRFLTEEGRAVTGWQRVAAINPGDTTWAGSLEVPKGIERYVRQARLASQRSDPASWFLDATRFAVGYRVRVFGQSQVDQLRSGTRGLRYQGGHPFSWIEQAANNANDISAINAFPVHDRHPALGDGVAGIMAAIEAAGCDAVVALELQGVGGSSARDWINDTLTGRAWTPMLRSNEVMDGGCSLAVWNWDAADIAINYGDLLDGVFLGTGPQASDHFVFGPLDDGGMQIGAGVLYIPTQRTSGSVTTESDFDTQGTWGVRRDEGVAWAASKPFVVIGAPPLDVELSDQFHPHLTNAAGVERNGRNLGFSMVRGLRLDNSQNPTINADSFAFTDGARTAFTFTVNLPNAGALRNGLGGSFDEGADKAVRLIELSENDGGAWTKSGFTAAITGRNRVTVTKNSGAWPVGLLARVGWGGFGAYGLPTSGITSGNTAARDYWMYDGYARHINGRGIPVLPSNTIYSVT